MQNFGGNDQPPAGQRPASTPGPQQAPGQNLGGPGNVGQPPPQPGQIPGQGYNTPGNVGQPVYPGWNPAQQHKPNMLLLLAAIGLGGLVGLLGFASGVDEGPGYALGRAMGGLFLPGIAGLITYLITKPKKNPALIAFIVLAALALLANMVALTGA